MCGKVQQGIGVFWRAILSRRYRYRWIQGKAFLRYGIEQQARMVEDFYIRRECGKTAINGMNVYPFKP